MKLTKTFDQCVIVFAMLATQVAEKPLTAKAINGQMHKQHHSITYTKKILRKLVLANLIKSIPGVNGGYLLAKDPKVITLKDIIIAIYGPVKSYSSNATLSNLFPRFGDKAQIVFNDVFKQADASWLSQLSKVTIYDIVKETIGQAYIPKIDWNKHDLYQNPLEQIDFKGDK